MDGEKVQNNSRKHQAEAEVQHSAHTVRYFEVQFKPCVCICIRICTLVSLSSPIRRNAAISYYCTDTATALTVVENRY